MNGRIIYKGGAVHTMAGPATPGGDPVDGRHADAVLVEGERIAAVGAIDDLLARAADGPDGEPPRVVDFGGGTITPGLTDSHSHPISGACLDAVGLDLTAADSLDQARAMLAAYLPTVPEGQWVKAWGSTPPSTMARASPSPRSRGSPPAGAS